MNNRVLGAILIVLSCACLGFGSAAGYAKEVRILESFRSAVRYMRNELNCRCIPLPDLCKCAADTSEGVVAAFWSNLASELEAQICPDPLQCTLGALSRTKNVPQSMCDAVHMVGKTLGAFDLQGQLDGFDNICMHLDEVIHKRTKQQDIRVRGYRTAGVCAGIALAIILI
jgi:stage III sporulation protein AB